MARILFLLVLLSGGAPENRAQAADSDRIRIYPILFVPRDTTLLPEDREQATQHLTRHLALARAQYREMLGTDTFEIEPQAALPVQHGHLTRAEYIEDENGSGPHPDARGLRVARTGSGDLSEFPFQPRSPQSRRPGSE